MKIAIVDDEEIYIDEITRLCRRFGEENADIVTVSAFSGGQAFLSAFSPDAYDVVFMDIFMDGMDGLETARRIRERDSRCLLVFLTSSTDYMPDAFSIHAFDYIVKPIFPQKVLQVLSDIRAQIPSLPPYVEIVSGRQTVPLLLSDIISVISDAHYLEIRTEKSGMFRCRMTVSRFLALAGYDPRFLNPNRGLLVNADHIRAVDSKQGICALSDGSMVPIRLREIPQLENALRQYRFSQIRREQQQTSQTDHPERRF